MSLTTGRDFIEPCIILSVQSHVYNYRVFAKFFSVAETWENVLTGHADVKEVGIIFMLNESPGVGGGVLNEVRPEVQPLSLSCTFFDGKGTPLTLYLL